MLPDHMENCVVLPEADYFLVLMNYKFLCVKLTSKFSASFLLKYIFLLKFIFYL